MTDRISQVTVTRGDHPLSTGLRHDAELVAQLRADMASGEVSQKRLGEMLRHVEQRLQWRANEATQIEMAAKAAMGASNV